MTGGGANAPGDDRGVTGRPTDPDALERALRDLARAPSLLVASDFDGTLAPIAATPDAVVADEAALEALSALAALPGTHAAILSGRGREALRGFVGRPPAIRLIGSHGAETEDGLSLPPGARRLRADLIEALRPLASRYEGSIVEPKPTGVAFHVRRVDPERRDDAAAAALERAATRPGVQVQHGHEVIELLVVEADKGVALARLRAELEPDAILFVGDDRTDEHAFARLGDGDLGVKVGPGDTRAAARIAAQDQVAPLLGRLLRLRLDAGPGPALSPG